MGAGQVVVVKLLAELAAAAAPKWGAPVSVFDGKTLMGWTLRDPKAKMGWAVVNGDELHGMIFFHGGDDSEFVGKKKAKRPKGK